MTAGMSRWEKLRRTGRVSWSVRPLDLLRRRLTRGLDVAAPDREVRRGEQIEALVTIGDPRELGDVEVGLVCTEHYDEKVSSRGSDGSTTHSRSTREAVAHETWVPVESASGVQSVRFTIPPDAPFSYQGTCLSFTWELVARGRRPRRLDAQARHEIAVLP